MKCLRRYIRKQKVEDIELNVISYNSLFKAFGELQENEMLKAVYEEAKGRDI